MIRPMSEIEYPPSEALRMKAALIARMEALAGSSNNMMAAIAERVGAEELRKNQEILALSEEQQVLLDNMRRLVGSSD